MNATLTAKEHIEDLARKALVRGDKGDPRGAANEFFEGLKGHPETRFLHDDTPGLRGQLIDAAWAGRVEFARVMRNIPIDHWIID